MNNELMHWFFMVFTRDFHYRMEQYTLQSNQYDEFLLGAATALFNIFRYEAYHNDALEFSDFLKRLNELAEQHIKECKEGENNE